MPVRNSSLCLTLVAALVTTSGEAAAARAAWNAESVSALATQLVEQSESLMSALRATAEKTETSTDSPELAVGSGPRTVAIVDLSKMSNAAKDYSQALGNGLGREETRSLFGQLDAQTALAAQAIRRLPDYSEHEASWKALEKTVADLGRFYAEPRIVPDLPDDQLDRPDIGAP